MTAIVRAALLLLLMAYAPARAAENPVPGQDTASRNNARGYSLFPHLEDLFPRLLADPRQAQTSVRYYRAQGFNLADVALGNTWGILRWRDLGGSGWDAQWNLEGMAYSRFRLGGGINEFQTIDFFANIPMEVRRGIYSGRLTLFHESSHLGDDYIRRTNNLGFRYSVEGLNGLASVEPLPWLRLYGGGMILLHQIPKAQDGALQWGFELKTFDLHWFEGRSAWFYLAQDFSNKGRVKWNLDSNTEAGLRLGVPHVVRAMRLHIGYYEGHSPFAQFFSNREHYFSLGTSFEF